MKTIFTCIVISLLAIQMNFCSIPDNLSNTDKDQLSLLVDWKKIGTELKGEYFSNSSVILVESKANELGVAQRTSSEALYNRVYTLASEKPFMFEWNNVALNETAIISLADALIFYNPSLGKPKIFAVSPDRATEIKKYLSTKGTDSEFFIGYGLTVNKGSWDLKKDFGTRELSLFNSIDFYSKNKKSGSKVAESCTSGGPGSSSCSISEPWGMGCSVICSDGFYACCDSSTTKCNCKTAVR